MLVQLRALNANSQPQVCMARPPLQPNRGRSEQTTKTLTISVLFLGASHESHRHESGQHAKPDGGPVEQVAQTPIEPSVKCRA